MTRTHTYATQTRWIGNRGSGTSGFRDYDRDHETTAGDRPVLAASSDPGFRGSPDRWNPELLLVASLSQCHMLWYLHLAAVDGVVVTAYSDAAEGAMREGADGGGRFTEVVLRPTVTVAEAGMTEQAEALHGRASELCFIANSVAFPVRHEPRAVEVGR